MTDEFKDVTITYHLYEKRSLHRIFRADLPETVWMSIREEFIDDSEIVIFTIDDLEVILPKNSIVFITMTISESSPVS